MSNNILQVRRSKFHPNDFCILELRTHDLGGTNYYDLMRLSFEQAESLVLGDMDIRWRFDTDRPSSGECDTAVPGRLQMRLRRDQQDNAELWDLRLLTDGPDGEDEHICNFNNENMIILLREFGETVFENYENDMHDHDCMEMQFNINALRSRADDLEERRTRKITEYKKKSNYSGSPKQVTHMQIEMCG